MPHIKGIPRTLEICGVTYDIFCTERIRAEDDRIIWGLHDPNSAVIYLSRECTNPDIRKMVLLHEAMHGIDTYHNLGIGTDEEEKILRPLSVAMYELLKQNPGVWSF